MSEVDAYLATLSPDNRRVIDALRGIAVAAEPALVETIKWNAPNFTLNGEDRITLGIERKGGVRAVLHRGSKPIDDGFSFDDPDRLATWAAPDRGALRFADAAAIEARREAVTSLFSRWLAATA